MKDFFRFLLFGISFFAIITCKKEADIPPKATKHLKISVLAKNFEVPLGMVYLPNKNFIFRERKGNITLMKNGSSNYNLS